MRFDDNNVRSYVKECERELDEIFARIDDIALYNQKKVLDAFASNGVQARHFAGTAGRAEN